MNRREFLAVSGAGVMASLTSRNGQDNVKLARVCVSSWSFHTLFEQKPPALDVRDFPDMVADRYHVHNVEIVLPHFLGAEPSLIREFKARLDKARSRLVNIPLDYGQLWDRAAISSADAADREAALALYRRGIDIAHDLGSPSVRCDPGTVNLADPALTIDAYAQLAAYARTKNIGVIVENHGDISKNPEVLVRILHASGVGALPDFGNFPDQATRERGLEAMFPLARGIAHAKLREGLDFARCMAIAKAAGFTGVFSVEAGGRGDSYEEVQKIVDALVSQL